MSRRRNFKRHGVRLHVQLYRDVIDSAQYASLSCRAVKLLIDLYAQFRGHNNGDLSAAWTIMKPRGWSSKDQLGKALKELLDKKWIGVSRRPRARRDPQLYFMTFLAINACNGKLDVAATDVPSNAWRRDETTCSPTKEDRYAA